MKLKNQVGKDIITYGGASFASALVKYGLIDEYHLFINQAAIGKGQSIFKEISGKLNLKLIQAIHFECGIAVLHCEPDKS
ncbi:dihydrofolate reductase family protein [Brucepastera parasyntrophica]|uniref:dihydrofolate reductase family protein n=1 Tax=Brucepastera parasyntrophica TaxID=2880008 RepID=UPI003F714966